MQPLRRLLAACTLVLPVVLGGCEGGKSDVAEVGPAPIPPVKELPGLTNYRRWSEHVAQGAQPEGDAARR